MPTVRYVFTLLIVALSIPQTVFASIVVTEIMHNPPVAEDAGYEWIEIIHNEKENIPADAVQIVVNDVSLPIQSTGVRSLPPRKASVIVQDKDLFLSDYPEYLGLLFVSSFSLNQNGTVRVDINGKRGQAVHYQPDSRSNGTGGSVHYVSGVPVAAPATPGIVATNPIPFFHEPKPPAQQVTSLHDEPSKSEERDEQYQIAPTAVSVNQDTNPILIWIAVVLTIIAIELLAILYALYRKI